MTINIIVCTKAVPGFIQNPQVPETQDRINYEAGSIVVNESDDYALEAGIKLAKKLGGKTTVLTAGSLSSQKVLQIGLGKDADGAIRVDADLFEPAKIAQVLALAIECQDFDLILTGVESSDNMAAQVGVSIAELLGLPFAYAVTEIEQVEGQKTIKITKELGFGKKQVEEIVLPALICFQTGTEPPSFVPLRKMMMAKSKPIKTLTLKDLDLEDQFSKMAFVKIVDVFSPKEMSTAEMIEGEPSEQASVLMTKIREVI
jgi:electron transfer flavoprotein beta subunit